MSSIGEIVTRILEPYVGHAVADACVRTTARTMGKTPDALVDEDLPTLEADIQRFLAPLTSRVTLESIIAKIKKEVLAP